MKNLPLRRPPATQTNLRPPHTPPTPISSRTRSKSCPSPPSTTLPCPRACPGSVYLPDGRRRSSRLSVSEKYAVFREFRAGEDENGGCGRRRSVRFRVSEKGRPGGKEGNGGRERRRSGRFSVSEKDAAFGEIRVSRSSGRLFRGEEEGNGGCDRRRSLRLSVLEKNLSLREIRVPRRSGGEEEEDRGCVERPCTGALRKALSFDEIRVLRRCDGLKGGEKEVGGSTERWSVRVSFSEKDMACRDRVLRSSSRLWKEDEGGEHHTNLGRRVLRLLVSGKSVTFEKSRVATRLEKLKGREEKISDCRERDQRTPPMSGGESKRRRVERMIDGEQAEVIMCSDQRTLQSTTFGYWLAQDGGNAVLAADRGESGSLNLVERTLRKEQGRKTANVCSTEKFLQNTPLAQERAVENRRNAQTRMQHRQHGLSKCSTSSVQLEVAGNVLTKKEDTKRKSVNQNVVASMEGGGEKRNGQRDVTKVGCERIAKVDCDSSGWTKDQDLALRRAYLMANPSPHLWKKISKMMPGKSAKECYDRIHSYNETPPLPVPRSRKNKNCISPLNIFNLSNSKPGEGFNDKVKKMKNKQQRRILVQKTVRHILKKHSAVDQGQEKDLFSVFEPSLNTTKEAQHDKLPSPSNNVMKPNKFVLEEHNNSFPAAPVSLSTKTVDKENKPSPAVLKQIKNIDLHEKYINKLHEREARRKVLARASGFSSGEIAKDNVMPKAVLMKAARSSLLSKAKEAMDQYRKKVHSPSNFLGDTDTDCDDSNNSECDYSPS